MKKLLWYLIAGTKGGINRAKIINCLNDRPFNANQLAEKLDLDYKTIQHHLKVLKENRLITEEGNGYGNIFFLDGMLEREYDTFQSIWERVEQEKSE